MNNVRICEIDSGDIAELITLGSETNLSPWSARNYLDEIKNSHSIMLRLEDDSNDLIGFVVGRVIAASDAADAVDSEIYNIAVDERFRRRGFAQKLFDEFLVRCQGVFVRSIWLEVRESNLPAIEFYRKNGFHAVTKRRDFYSNPLEDAFLMMLDLASRR